MGLSLEMLKQDTELEVEVESYLVNEQDADAPGDEEDEEGLDGQTTGEEKVVKITFPKGSFIVYTDQKNANLACEVLEPENPNGFLAMKVIKINDHSVLPVYRYMSQNKIVH
jgi:hypothetical protein